MICLWMIYMIKQRNIGRISSKDTWSLLTCGKNMLKRREKAYWSYYRVTLICFYILFISWMNICIFLIKAVMIDLSTFKRIFLQIFKEKLHLVPFRHYMEQKLLEYFLYLYVLREVSDWLLVIICFLKKKSTDKLPVFINYLYKF